MKKSLQKTIRVLSPEEEEKKRLEEKRAEAKLLPRLKIVAYALFVAAAVSFAYAVVPMQDEGPAELALGLPPFEEDSLFELAPKEVLNFYVIGSVFAVVGALMFWTASRRTLKN